MSDPGLEGSGSKASALAVWAWILYDFSNTIFSTSILTFYFPFWLGAEIGRGSEAVFNFAVAISALLVFFTAPVLGAMADLRQRRVLYLVVLTLISVLLTVLLDVAGGVVIGVALFVAADLAYQSAIVFYNALLLGVAAGRGAGKISGYGTAAGYIGTIFALVVLTLFVSQAETVRSLLGPVGGWVETGEEPISNTFLPTAVLYLLFSLPAFFLVPDPAVRAPRPVALGAAYRAVISTVKNLRGYAGVAMFILAAVLYMDAANTAVTNMALYGQRVFGMTSPEVRDLLLFSVVFAVVGSVAAGFATDRVGPKRVLLAVLALWFISILLVSTALGPWMLLLAGPLVGIALGGTWTTSRVMLVALSPPEKLGEFFGLFSLAGRFSAVLGPALTALLLLIFGGLGATAYRISVGSLSLIMLLGIFFLSRVPDARPESYVDGFAGERRAPLIRQPEEWEQTGGMRQPEDVRTRLVALRGRVVTDYEVWTEGTVLLEGESIRDVSPGGELLADADEVHDHADSLLLPGFVDLQVNGAFGVDVAMEPSRMAELSEALLSTGTTAYLPTIISSPESLYEEVLPELAAAAGGPSSGAEVLGVHLEGPFINLEKRGAHAAAHVVPPDQGLLARLLDLAPVRAVTLAPELEGAGELMALAANRGVVVSAGHSGATFEVAYEVLDASVAGVTHLFNAMSAMHHREPGLPGAAFAHPRVVCGLIADGFHVHPEMVALAFRMLGPDRVYLTTDAISAAGMGDGEYRLATRTVYLHGGVPRLGSGAIAGSILTMGEAFRNVLAFTGCTLPEAARMASTTPARLVGEGRRKGRITPGYDADIAVLAPDLSVEAVWRGGEVAYERGGSSR